LALPIAARGVGADTALGARTTPVAGPPPQPAPARATPHVTLIVLDGASLDYIWPRVASGRLPNLGRLLDRGALMNLATIRPTQPDPVWTAVATGIYPNRNGVRSAASYYAPGDQRGVDLLPDHCFSHVLVRLGVVRDQPNSSTAWRARPLWSILGRYGISSGVVRWPLTYPAQPVDGFLVTDRFHQVVGSMSEFAEAAYPAELLPIVRDAFGGQPPTAADPADMAARRDELYAKAWRELQVARPVRFSAIRFQGIDAVSHMFLRYAQPQDFAGVSENDRQRYGSILDRYYAYVDAQIGTAVEHLQPDDLLLVVSGFGMQPVGPVERAINRVLRDPDVSGTHAGAPDGFLLAYGSNVQAGRNQRGSIVDVTPTILYYLGLPVGRDMDGYTRADLFAPSLTSSRPITFIPSHGR
jgi:predicted AlkP superfamily phosphohydrolase/phosphomutase